jgi:hypothetical protein
MQTPEQQAQALAHALAVALDNTNQLDGSGNLKEVERTILENIPLVQLIRLGEVATMVKEKVENGAMRSKETYGLAKQRIFEARKAGLEI